MLRKYEVLQKLGKDFESNRSYYTEIQKATTGPKVTSLLRQCLDIQKDRHEEELVSMDERIARQNEELVKQSEQIAALKELVGSGGGAANYIQVENIQKVKELEADDKLRVMEFLFKEMMEAKGQLNEERKYMAEVLEN